MKYLHIFLISMCLFGILNIPVNAFEIRMEPDISITENYVSNENMYLVGLRSWFNTSHQKDVVSLALDQTISGSIFGDVLLFGNKVNITGEYFDDIRIAANAIHVSGVINRDLVIVGRDVVIEPNAIINGDSLILANSVIIRGQILGQNQITANTITIAGTIVGQSTITGQKINFTKEANTISEISYFSPKRADIEEGAQIKGNLNYNQIQSITQTDIVKRVFFGLVSFWAIIKLVATLFILFILTQIFRVFSQRIIDIILYKKFYIILIGLLSFIAMPILIVILFGSLVLIPIALILACVFGIMIMLLSAISAIGVSALYQKVIAKKPKITTDFYTSALALVVLTFIGFVPYVGDWIVRALYLGAFGAMSVYLYEQVRRKKIL